MWVCTIGQSNASLSLVMKRESTEELSLSALYINGLNYAHELHEVQTYTVQIYQKKN